MPEPMDPTVERALVVELFNAAWALIEPPRSSPTLKTASR